MDAELERRGIDQVAPLPTVDPTQDELHPAGKVDLKLVTCLQDFPNGEMRELVKQAPPRMYPEGYELCREGARGDCCWILATGFVDVFRNVRGVEHHLATIEGGTLLGAMALVDGSDRSATLRVRRPSVILRLDRTPFVQALLKGMPYAARFQRQLAVTGIRQLRFATEHLAHMLDQAPDRTPDGPVEVFHLSSVGPTQIRNPDRWETRNTMELAFLRAATNEWGLELDSFERQAAS